MISYLTGTIVGKEGSSATILVGGVGYEVFLSSKDASELKQNQEVVFHVYTHVREDVLALYGFSSLDEMKFFKLLLSVSGIGPKVALGIIGSAPLDKLKSSIAAGDPMLLSSVSGVGKKTAEKAVVELRGKLKAGQGRENGFLIDENEEVYEALESLGLKPAEISQALSEIPSEICGADGKIKAVLKLIGKKK